MDCSMPGFPVHHQLLELTQTHVHWVGDAIQPPHPLSSLLLLPSLFPSLRVFSKESVLHIRWPKDWSFSFSISPSSEYSGLISFRIVWLDLLAVQGTLKSLLQHHSSKASVLRHSAFFMVQLSHPYMTTGKTTDLTIHIFVGKITSLLFNMLFKFVMGFPGGSDGKGSACNAGDASSISRSGRSPGEGNGNPLQYSCLKIPWMGEPGVHGVTELDTTERLHFTSLVRM